MRYADTLLSEGEVIVHRARQHWLALILDARAAVVLFVLGIALLLAVAFLNPDPSLGQLISVAALVCLAIALVLFGYKWWQWWAQDYMVTNRRLMKVTGILNKRSSDSSLEKINDAVLEQNVLGRIMNYGDLDILTASSESGIDYFRMLNGAKEFKRVMLNQKHALETGYMYERPPSPPLRAEPMDMNGERGGSTVGAQSSEPAPPNPSATATAPVAASPPAPAPERDDSLEVTQALSRLADLRDRGAIDPEDYERKKDELLGRL
jgi:hypothetical protein